MPNKMLIDASHPEETRVVVTRGQKVEEFDFESANRRQLRGNIYLAKVTRVEPSLQAAFIEYGGNRHGFLAFGEIHPDYYQIPVADRQALLEADERAEQEAEREEERPRGRRRRGSSRRHRDRGETVTAPATHDDHPAAGEDGDRDPSGDHAESGDLFDSASLASDAGAEEAVAARLESPPEASLSAEAGGYAADAADRAEEPHGEDDGPRASGDSGEEPSWSGEDHDGEPAEARSPSHDEDDDEDEDEDEDDDLEEHEVVEQVGGGDALEDVPERPRVHRRSYKIQEVIKRRQILLVQVVKEERGNKGAALTTYLSLAGRYSVLMPNTGKGGGISRKITSAEDRKRLKEMVQELEVPQGMGVILRTAGANRTKPEIKRDYEYLMRLWESVRELTLTSSAPALVYEEGSLIKRSIRDLYNKDIDEVVVAGDEGFEEARDFMKLIMPAQLKAVRLYRESQPLFVSSGVEAQLDAMFSNHVTLKSGGYLVINPTEALVSIDVNSGRSTREHNIEDTALRTNMEASEEIARQLRLRDLAGLIVIDFIDMEERRNNRSVEKKLKDCLKNDRARIQVGRISPFGLLEMSRQRIRTGVLESSSIPCPTCGGIGSVRAIPSVALQVLRSIEESLLRSATHNLLVRTRTEVAFYILNAKRAHLREIETRFGVSVTVAPDDTLGGKTTFSIDRGEPAIAAERPAPATRIRVDTITPVDEPIEIEPTAEYERDEEEAAEATEAAPVAAEGEEDGRRRRRRRRRRGGRNGSRDEEGRGEEAEDATDREDDEAQAEPLLAESQEPEAVVERPAPLPPPIERAVAEPIPEPPFQRPNAANDVGADGPTPEPAATTEPEPEPVAVVLTPPDPDRPRRAGWWSKAKAALGGS